MDINPKAVINSLRQQAPVTPTDECAKIRSSGQEYAFNYIEQGVYPNFNTSDGVVKLGDGKIRITHSSIVDSSTQDIRFNQLEVVDGYSANVALSDAKVTLTLSSKVSVPASMATDLPGLKSAFPAASNKGKVLFLENDSTWYWCNGTDWFKLYNKELNTDLTAAKDTTMRFPQHISVLSDGDVIPSVSGLSYVAKTSPTVPVEIRNNHGLFIFTFVKTDTETKVTQMGYSDGSNDVYKRFVYFDSVSGSNKWSAWINISVEDVHPYICCTWEMDWAAWKNASAAESERWKPYLGVYATNCNIPNLPTTPGHDRVIFVPKTTEYVISGRIHARAYDPSSPSDNIQPLAGEFTIILYKYAAGTNVRTTLATFKATEAPATIGSRQYFVPITFQTQPIQLVRNDEIMMRIVPPTNLQADDQKANLDAFKNYLVLEEKGYVAGKSIAEMFRLSAGGFWHQAGTDARTSLVGNNVSVVGTRVPTTSIASVQQP